MVAQEGDVDGESMSGTTEVGRMGSGEWKAGRVE